MAGVRVLLCAGAVNGGSSRCWGHRVSGGGGATRTRLIIGRQGGEVQREMAARASELSFLATRAPGGVSELNAVSLGAQLSRDSSDERARFQTRAQVLGLPS